MVAADSCSTATSLVPGLAQNMAEVVSVSHTPKACSASNWLQASGPIACCTALI